MKHQVVVCGAGIVGLSCVLALSRAGVKTALVAPRPGLPAAAGEIYHPRVYAISPASRQFLSDLGVWDMLPDTRIGRMSGIDIFGDNGGELHLNAWQAATDQLAWIVESSEIERVLTQAVAWSGVPWIDDAVTAWSAGELRTAKGQVLLAELCVGADGAASPLRQLAGLAHHSTPYGDVGLVAHFDVEHPHQDTAFQWFTDEGVLALLPLPDTARGPQVSMVWSVRASRAQDVRSLAAPAQAARLPAMLATVTGNRLGRLSLNSAVHGFPLYVEHADVVAPGIALVGDAAHRVHPLAGQGLNLGLGDVQTLAEIVSQRAPFRSAGDMHVLRRYRRERVEPITAMRIVTDGLHRLFNNPVAPVSWLRNTGLNLVDAIPPLKRVLVGQASGVRRNS